MSIRSEQEVYENDLQSNGETLEIFSINEKVLYVNDYGVCFIMEILGFSDDGKIHTKGGAYWCGSLPYHFYKLPYDVKNFTDTILYDLGEVLQPIAKDYGHYYNVAEFFREDVLKFFKLMN